MLQTDIAMSPKFKDIQKNNKNIYLNKLPELCIFCNSPRIFRTFYFLKYNAKEMLYNCLNCKKNFYVIIKGK